MNWSLALAERRTDAMEGDSSASMAYNEQGTDSYIFFYRIMRLEGSSICSKFFSDSILANFTLYEEMGPIAVAISFVF